MSTRFTKEKPNPNMPVYVTDAAHQREAGKREAELKRQMSRKQNPAGSGGPTRKADRLVNGPTRRALRRLHA